MKNLLYSVMTNRCAHCHKGPVFISDNPYNLKKFDKMHTSCSCCGEVYEKEPGYFFGAMYVSYALMTGWFLITFALDSWFFHLSSEVYMSMIITTILFFVPVTFRTSRLIWLNFFTDYDQNACRNCEIQKT